MKNTQSVTVKGQLFWTFDMTTPPTKFNPTNTRYQATIGQFSDADAKKIESLGCKIKFKDTQGKYIVAKSKFAIAPLDTKGNIVDTTKLGNGSEVTVELSSYDHPMSEIHGQAPSIKKMTVTKVVTYNPEAVIEEALDDVL